VSNYESDVAAGTVWGAVNAVTEYVDHQQRRRSDETRLSAIWLGEGDRLKQDAYRQALALAT
jgi:hypothetical protein